MDTLVLSNQNSMPVGWLDKVVKAKLRKQALYNPW